MKFVLLITCELEDGQRVKQSFEMHIFVCIVSRERKKSGIGTTTATLRKNVNIGLWTIVLIFFNWNIAVSGIALISNTAYSVVDFLCN